MSKLTKHQKIILGILAGIVALCFCCVAAYVTMDQLGLLATATITPSPFPTETERPTQTLTSTPAATETPINILPTATLFPACDCQADTLNCDSFPTPNDAQNCFLYCNAIGAGDIYGLDGDNNGFACEYNP